MAEKSKHTTEVTEAPPPYSSGRPSLEVDSARSTQATKSPESQGERTHQRFVLTDPVALKYGLLSQPACTNLTACL